MSSSAPKRVTYQDLLDLPENVIGEIIEGQLITSPRPSGTHVAVSSSLGDDLVGPFQKGRGGPGGWWILDEPEIKFEFEINHCVPDLAGWRKDRMPKVPDGHIFDVVPDWICEIVSPSSKRRDRVEKFNLYARYEVGFYWIIDPEIKSLEAFRLEQGHWVSLGVFADAIKVKLQPFDAVEIDLSQLWP